VRRLVVVSLCLALGCSDGVEPSAQAPAPRDPAELGPYGIGVTSLEVESSGRTLPIEVWYPAAQGGAPEQYVVKIGVLELARFDSPHAARRDAPLDRRGAPFPVVVFSHGNGGIRIQSVYLTEWLASHGFVVAAPDHVGNTLAEQVNQANAIPAAEAAVLRPGDVSRTLDAVLAAADTPGARLRRAVDPERVGVAGHSFGGFTALRVAGASVDAQAMLAECNASGGLVCDGWQDVSMPASALDTRFRAALAHAPGGAQAMYAGNRNGFADVSMPVMIQGGESDQLTPFAKEQKAPYGSLPSPAALVEIARAGHFTFSDMCLLVEKLGLTLDAFDDGCGPDNVPWADAHALIDAYSTAFFQHTLLGADPSDRLDPAAAPPAGVLGFDSK